MPDVAEGLPLACSAPSVVRTLASADRNEGAATKVVKLGGKHRPDILGLGREDEASPEDFHLRGVSLGLPEPRGPQLASPVRLCVLELGQRRCDACSHHHSVIPVWLCRRGSQTKETRWDHRRPLAQLVDLPVPGELGDRCRQTQDGGEGRQQGWPRLKEDFCQHYWYCLVRYS